MKAKDVMHIGVTWVEPSTPLTELAKRMRDEDIGAIPVGENDRLVVWSPTVISHVGGLRMAAIKRASPPAM